MANTLEDFLSHHGVLGQKWGVRKDNGHTGERTTTKKIAKLDNKFAKRTNSLAVKISLYNIAVAKSNALDIDRINNKAKYKDADFSKPSTLRTQYYKEHTDAFVKRLDEAAKSVGTNASGTEKYTISVADDGDWHVSLSAVQHAEDSSFVVHVTYDSTGHITNLTPVEPITHSDLGADFLEQSGVLGMHWGQHLPGKTEASHNPPKQKIISEDHSKAHEALKKPVSSLSTKEIQDTNNRLQAEKKLSELKSQSAVISKGHNKIKAVLAIAGTVTTAVALLQKTPAGKKAIAAGGSAIARMVLGGGGKHAIGTALAKSAARHLV